MDKPVKPKLFLTAQDCADRYGFSVRHWRRMQSAGLCPDPVRFQRLLRWKLETLEEWEANGGSAKRRAGYK